MLACVLQKLLQDPTQLSVLCYCDPFLQLQDISHSEKKKCI